MGDKGKSTEKTTTTQSAESTKPPPSNVKSTAPTIVPTKKDASIPSKTSDDTEERQNTQGSATTSPSIPTDIIAECSKGVKMDNIENDYFHPSFMINQVAQKQHNPELRPKAASRETITVPNGVDESSVIKVIAKEVLPKGDKLCYITVKQASFLGAGAFSDVFVGYVSKLSHGDKARGEQVAIKKIWPDPSREDRQIAVHRKLDHINLVKLRYYYVCVHPKTKMTMWTLIMDLMPSTISTEQSKYIEKGKIMSFLYVKLFMYQTFAGLKYLEKAGFLHRDIKPENLLVCMQSGKLKIGDFGSAKHYKQGARLSAYQVTRYYRAPELCLKYTYYDPTVDIWAAGCILAELLTNRIVFYGSSNRDQLLKIIRICGSPTIDQLAQCVPGITVDEEVLATTYPPADWYKIIRRYNKAITPIGADFLHKVLRYERALRLRGDDALRHPFFDSLRNPSGRLGNGSVFPPLAGINC